MSDYSWLEVQIKQESESEILLEVSLQDDTTTPIRVHPTCIVKQGNKTYLKIESMGSKGGLSYIKLPAPSLQHGYNITVNKSKLKQDLLDKNDKNKKGRLGSDQTRQN